KTPMIRALLSSHPSQALEALRPAPRYASHLGPVMRDHVLRMRSLGYPSARHCFEFMHEIDGLRQLAALQNGLAADMFRVVPVVKHTSYAQVECYCEDCGLITGHYSSLVYERRITLCSDCSLRRYLSRDWTDEQNAADDDALGPASQATASAMS
ncbi:MAG: hypothetical protein KJZ78_06685, partial [Bryobacteraceae bacterium]|nr:hypothetical protein [Bryobacteraceae bacterium]